MIRFDESSADCRVLTFKEGLLSAVAHDLLLRVGAFSVEVDDARRSVVATFDPRSLRVVCAMQGGVEKPRALTDANRSEIESNIVRHVLEPDRHPVIRFESTAVDDTPGGWAVEGSLSLHGTTRPIRVAVTRGADATVAEATVHQPDFGIRPYSALLGALRVRPDVVVRVVLPTR